MKRVLGVLIVLFLLVSCVPQQEPEPNLGQYVIETLVAATLTADVSDKEMPDQPTDTQEPAADDNSQPPTPTPTPTLTHTHTPTPTATNTETPTPTLTLTPTATSTPEQVAGDPVASLGSPTFKDTFEDGDNFYLYDETQSSYQVDDGQMILIAKKANSYETWSLSWGDLKNFYLEITGTFGDECGGKDRYGMLFRAPDTSQGYIISISCDGSTRLSLWDSDAEEYTVIKNWTSSEHINSGPGAINRLGIKAKGSTLTCYINGHQIFEKSDSKFSKGQYGIMVAASDTAGFTSYLSQVVYWNLP